MRQRSKLALEFITQANPRATFINFSFGGSCLFQGKEHSSQACFVNGALGGRVTDRKQIQKPAAP